VGQQGHGLTSSFSTRLRSIKSYAFGDTRVPSLVLSSIDVQSPPTRHAHRLLFRTLEDKEVLPQKLFWVVVFNAFVMANLPTARISAAGFSVLEVLPDTLSKKLLPLSADMQRASQQITEHVFVPLKELLFLLSLLAIAYPIIRCVSKSRGFWRRLGIKRTVLPALTLFAALSFLVFPYSYPRGLHSHPSGLAGNGQIFGQMSVAPFQENNPMFYKRLLKPAIAHFIHLDGYLRYYFFSLVCTYILILLTVVFSETRLLPATSGERHLQTPNPTARWLIYLSLMTSSFLLTDFQWPGYSDHLSFILVLLMAIIPITSQARLATLALCLLNHDGIALALVPVILCCFPKPERVTALLGVGLFYGIVAAGFGFSIHTGLQGHHSVTASGSVWEAVLQDPGFFLASLFFTYKLLWIVPAIAVAMLLNQKDKATLTAIVGITFFPVLLTLLAWDTTRVAGFGWLGLLIALGILMQEWRRRPKVYHYALLALISANLVFPSYNVVLGFKDTFSKYPYPGFYMLIDSTARLLLK
jgi:hypothetical protein